MKKQVTLGVQGLTDLENYLKQYERAVKQTRKELVDELCVTGEALLAEYSPVEDHELKSSTASLVQHGPKTSRGVLFQAAPHAPFVEFGTGLVGSQSPHPDSSEYGWAYDTNSHGADGWYYYDPDQDRVRWTKGQVASCQHLKTAVDLRSVTGKVAKELLQRGMKS